VHLSVTLARTVLGRCGRSTAIGLIFDKWVETPVQNLFLLRLKKI